VSRSGSPLAPTGHRQSCATALRWPHPAIGGLVFMSRSGGPMRWAVHRGRDLDRRLGDAPRQPVRGRIEHLSTRSSGAGMIAKGTE